MKYSSVHIVLLTIRIENSNCNILRADKNILKVIANCIVYEKVNLFENCALKL